MHVTVFMCWHINYCLLRFYAKGIITISIEIFLINKAPNKFLLYYNLSCLSLSYGALFRSNFVAKTLEIFFFSDKMLVQILTNISI